MDAFSVVCASLFTGLAVWFCSSVASSGDTFIFWGLLFRGYDAAILDDRFPTFIRNTVSSPSGVRTLNPLWYNFFFFKTSETVHSVTRRQIPEEHISQLHQRGDLKIRLWYFVSTPLTRTGEWISNYRNSSAVMLP